MIDPSLLILLSGATLASYIIISKLFENIASVHLPEWLIAHRYKVDNCCLCMGDLCLTGIILTDVYCIETEGAQIVQTIVKHPSIAGLAVIFSSKDYSKLVKRIETMLTTYRIMLERYPENKRIYLRKKVLEELMNKLISGRRPLEASIIVLVRAKKDECSKKAEEVKTMLKLRDCVVRKLCGGELLKILVRGKKSSIVGDDVVQEIIDAEAVALPSNGVYIGREIETSLPVFVNVDKGHVLVIGPTGSGKTTLLASIAARTIALDEMGHVYIIDPKGDLYYMLQDYMETVDLATNGLTGESSNIIGSISVRHILYRLRIRDNSGLKLISQALANLMAKDGSKLIIVDEAWRLTRGLIEHFIPLVKESRSYGTSLILATQDPEDVPEEVWNNVKTIIAFGSQDQGYIVKLKRVIELSSVDAERLRKLRVGRVAIRYWQRRRPVFAIVEPTQVILKNLSAWRGNNSWVRR